MFTQHEMDNFPNASERVSRYWPFLNDRELDDFAFSQINSGNPEVGVAPVSVNDAHGGTVTCTCSAADNDSLQAQLKAETCRFNRLGKVYKFLFEKVLFNDDDQIDWMLGVGILDTTMQGDAAYFSDGVFIRHVDGETVFRCGHAMNATGTGDYSEISTGTIDSSEHTFAIQVELDASTLGAGTITFYKDGAVLTSYPVATGLPHDEELSAICWGVKNGEAVAKAITLGGVGYDIPKAA